MAWTPVGTLADGFVIAKGTGGVAIQFLSAPPPPGTPTNVISVVA